MTTKIIMTCDELLLLVAKEKSLPVETLFIVHDKRENVFYIEQELDEVENE